MAEWETFFWGNGMSCHSFLHAVRYGNTIIGVYVRGSGSIEPFCVRLAEKAEAGSDGRVTPALGASL